MSKIEAAFQVLRHYCVCLDQQIEMETQQHTKATNKRPSNNANTSRSQTATFTDPNTDRSITATTSDLRVGQALDDITNYIVTHTTSTTSLEEAGVEEHQQKQHHYHLQCIRLRKLFDIFISISTKQSTLFKAKNNDNNAISSFSCSSIINVSPCITKIVASVLAHVQLWANFTNPTTTTTNRINNIMPFITTATPLLWEWVELAQYMIDRVSSCLDAQLGLNICRVVIDTTIQSLCTSAAHVLLDLCETTAVFCSKSELYNSESFTALRVAASEALVRDFLEAEPSRRKKDVKTSKPNKKSPPAALQKHQATQQDLVSLDLIFHVQDLIGSRWT